MHACRCDIHVRQHGDATAVDADVHVMPIATASYMYMCTLNLNRLSRIRA